ncbi:MAG: retropepsin-like aspartic protease [Terriglobia bacterium]
MKNWAIFIAGCISSLLLISPSMAEPERGEVSFELYLGYVIVAEGEIGPLRGLHFLIDTGTMPSIVDKRITHCLHLALSGEAESVTVFGRSIKGQHVALPGLKFGPIRMESVPVLVRDLSPIEKELGAHIDAVLGLDVLGSRPFTIDFVNRRISFAPESSTHLSRAINSQLRCLVVITEIQGRPVRLLVDTGVRDLILFKQDTRGRLLKLRVSGEESTPKLGGKARLRQVALPPIRLGDTEFAHLHTLLMDTPAAEASNFDGLLGTASLGARLISIDFERNRLTWVR